MIRKTIQVDLRRRSAMRAHIFLALAPVWAVLIILSATACIHGAQGTNSALRADFNTFQIITERNIFDPNRVPRSSKSLPVRRPKPERSTRAEALVLLGTMSYEKGRFAFFDGTSPEYRKVLKTTGTIAGFTVSEITPTHIRLESEGKTIELPVGMQLKKQDDGGWVAGVATEISSTPGASSSSSGKSEASSGGAARDALKRLMQKREQEVDGKKPESPSTTEPIENPPPQIEMPPVDAPPTEDDNGATR